MQSVFQDYFGPDELSLLSFAEVVFEFILRLCTQGYWNSHSLSVLSELSAVLLIPSDFLRIAVVIN